MPCKLSLDFAYVPLIYCSLFLVACDSGSDVPIDPSSELPTIESAKFALLDSAGLTERVSLGHLAIESNGRSINAVVSVDGQIVVFDSIADNLVADDLNHSWDIFARNRRDNTLHRLTVAADGSESNGDSLSPQMSDDGRYVTFVSAASNLVANDTNGVEDIFVRDLVANTTVRVSIASDGSEADGLSLSPRISNDGRFVVFVSMATNLSLADTDVGRDIYRHDLTSGNTLLVSANSAGVAGDADSLSPDISRDGNSIVYSSTATNLVEGDTNGVSDIFVKMISDGSNVRASTNPDGIQADAASDLPRVSSDGRVVAFRSLASNLVAGVPASQRQIIVKDLMSNTLELVSVNSQGEVGNGTNLGKIGISGDGRFIFFYGDSSNIEVIDDNDAWDVFVHDRVDHSTQIVSVDSAGVVGNASSFEPSISDNGNYVVFGSSAALVPTDTNDAWDIYIHVLQPHNFPPIANISIDSMRGESPLTVTVDASGSSDPEGQNVTFIWDFGDIQSDSNQSELIADSHTYALPGTYTMVLTVTDELVGLQSQAFTVVTVTSLNMPPVVLPTANIYSGEAPLGVVFSANASDPEAETLSYLWDFADGLTETTENPSHSFEIAGNYYVTVTVSDGRFESSAGMMIVVGSPLGLQLQKAVIDFEHGSQVNGKLSIQASVDVPESELSGPIQMSLKIDDFEVFNFYAEQAGELPSKFEYHSDSEHLEVHFNRLNGKLHIQREHVLFGQKIDQSNGVDFVLSINGLVAVQHVGMQVIDDKSKLLYELKN